MNETATTKTLPRRVPPEYYRLQIESVVRSTEKAIYVDFDGSMKEWIPRSVATVGLDPDDLATQKIDVKKFWFDKYLKGK